MLDMGAGVKLVLLSDAGSLRVLSSSAGIVGAAIRCISFSVGSKLGMSKRLSS